MLEIIKEKYFERDVKILHKKRYDFSRFSEILDYLVKNGTLDGKYNDHALKGNLQGLRECHIENNIIMIYEVTNNTLLLYRIGSHKDLLGK
mgnify:CR=1 FL=1